LVQCEAGAAEANNGRTVLGLRARVRVIHEIMAGEHSFEKISTECTLEIDFTKHEQKHHVNRNTMTRRLSSFYISLV
jgi:hypothetical protein